MLCSRTVGRVGVSHQGRSNRTSYLSMVKVITENPLFLYVYTIYSKEHQPDIFKSKACYEQEKKNNTLITNRH